MSIQRQNLIMTTPLPTPSRTILPLTPTTTSYLTVQKPIPNLHSIIDQTNKENHKIEDSWSQIVVNNQALNKQADSLRLDHATFRSPSGYGIYKKTDLNKQSLKMQKQEDIKEQLDYDNNLLILTGAALTLCVLLSLQLYMK